MQLHVILLFCRELISESQCLRCPPGLKVRTDQAKVCLEIPVVDSIEMSNCFSGRSLSDQKEAQVVVCVLILRIKPKNNPKLFFGQIKLLLGEVNVPDIVVGLTRVRG